MREKIRTRPASPMYSTPALDNRDPASIPSSPLVASSLSLQCSVRHGVHSVPTRPMAYPRSTIPTYRRSQCLQRILDTSAHGSTVHREQSRYPGKDRSRWSRSWDISGNHQNSSGSMSLSWSPLQHGRWILVTAPDLKTIRTYAKAARTKRDRIRVSYKPRKWTLCKAFNAVIKQEQSNEEQQTPHTAKYRHVGFSRFR